MPTFCDRPTKEDMDYIMKKIMLFVVLLLIAVSAFAFSPFFIIDEITIQGNNNIQLNELGYALQQNSDNIWLFSINQARHNILQLPYAQNVYITKNFINRSLHIYLIERQTIGYIEFNQDTFLFIDKEGIVLEIAPSPSRPLPTILGLNFDGFLLGNALNVENQQIFYKISYITNWLIAYDMERTISSIDVSDLFNIKLLYGNIVINIGDFNDINSKIRVAKSLLPQITSFKQIGGSLNIVDINRQWFFELLT